MKRLLYVVLLIAGAVVVPVPAQAAVCSGTSGVSVIVQFPDGHIETGCAPGDPATGIDALTQAGFINEPVPGQGGTVCRISGQPAAGEQCWQPPNYWAYFYAQRGGQWTYSTIGAGSHHPKQGAVEGWKFRGSPTNFPSMDPPGSPAPTPTATAPHPTAHVSNPVVKPVTTGQPVGKTPTAPDATTATGGTTTPSGGATATATDVNAPAADPTTTDGVASRDVVKYEPKGPSGDRSWIWGLLLIGGLAAAAGTIAFRRRRS